MNSIACEMENELFEKLTLIHPNELDTEINCLKTPSPPAINPNGLFKKLNVKNMPYDEEVNFDSHDGRYENKLYPPSPPSTYCSDDELEYSNSQESLKIGNGNFDYIEDIHERIMIDNAFQAISQTNMWEFIAKDIKSFMFSSDSRIELISKKMEELGYHSHSGLSFGCTMRNMQYLAKNGEDEFKKMYEKPTVVKTIKNNVLDYMGGY